MQNNITNAKIDLINKLGIDKMPKEQQEEILVQMNDIMQQRIINRFVEEIPEEKREQFLAMISNETTKQSEVDEFIATNVPQSEEMIVEEVAKYKEESLKLFQQIASDSE